MIFFVGDIVWSSFSSAAKERAMKLHGYSPSSLFMKKSFYPHLGYPWPIMGDLYPPISDLDPSWEIPDPSMMIPTPSMALKPLNLGPSLITLRPLMSHPWTSHRPLVPFFLLYWFFFFLNQKIVRRTKKMKKKHHFYFFYIQVGHWGFPTPLVPSPWPHVYPNGSVMVQKHITDWHTTFGEKMWM